MKRNPIEICDYIKEEFAEYIASTYRVDDEAYQVQINRELQSVELDKGPYLHTILPFETSYNVNELIERNILSSEFKRLKGIPFERKLYKHQVEAIVQAKEGQNLVVTTGTGSGKTESFLFPILNYIMQCIKEGKKEVGVKAILLYPMNALVNDQKERIRELLKNYPNITFGSFIGETPETKKETDRSSGEFLDNELLSREEMRETPPDILFTNNSMLEYLLIRPEDYSIISPNTMKQWKFMVLDEAHTFKGTLGIEIAILLKRLIGTVKKKPQFILTSATLGTKNNIPDIIRFATNLTSSRYVEKNIIFASRTPLNRVNIKYQLNPNVYTKLKDAIKDLSKVKQIASDYINVEKVLTVESCLYRLLIQDKNVYTLYDCIDNTNEYSYIYKKMNTYVEISNKDLISLVQLISLAFEDGFGIYDAKFHMFVSAPNRAFITLGKDKKIRFGNHISIDGYKAFEIGTCKKCNHLYIIGNISASGYLESDDTVDVYENYEESATGKLDFFMLDDPNGELEQYVVCSKCGRIYSKANLNASFCDCGKEYEVNLYKIENTGKKKNNIIQCAFCGQKSNTGIIQSFHLNKDSATSVLLQIYYEMLQQEETKKIENKVSFDLFAEQVEEVVERPVKQLLAFSDSRQQASFFSVFFKYNHERFLRKRLIWEELKKEPVINVRSLASLLKNRIEDENLFSGENRRAQSEAWISVLSDILYVDGQYSSEGIGLYSFDYDFKDKISTIKGMGEQIKSIFDLNADEFIVLIKVVIDRFRKDSAINYRIAELSDQEKKDAFQYIANEQYISLKKAPNMTSYESKFIKSFLPINEKFNNFIVDYLMKITMCTREVAIERATKLFIFMNNIKLFKDSISEGLDVKQLYAERFDVEVYSQNRWYRCDKCKKITLHNIKNMCPEKGCTGTLSECDVDEVFKDNYYRKQYKNKIIENIVIEEHTAQLKREKAKKYQDDFKKKKINVLSCSTTFEMGVDIGSLENVFLRNVPPTPANYVQRAGRAGRSKDSSALIVTYCGNTSHDYSYFAEPTKMIKGEIMPPLFSVSNKKIMIRHILATAFSYFFRIHPDYFRNKKEFVFETGMSSFIKYLESKPEDLNSFVNQELLNLNGFEEYKNFGWLEEILNEGSQLKLFIMEMKDKLQTYIDALEKSKKEDNFNLAKYFKFQIGELNKGTMVPLLSKYAVIPKYGFPVDTVELNVFNDESVGKDKNLNLQRDLSIALSEYAPDSEVVVDGNKYVSRYINTPKRQAGSLPRCYYYICKQCDQINVSLTPFTNECRCKHCNAPIEDLNSYFIIPKLGFSVDKDNKKSRTIRPKKTYAGEIKYLGGGIDEDKRVVYNDRIEITIIKNDQLVVLNEHNFYYCPECGFTKIEYDKFSPTLTKRTSHRSAYGYKCDNHTFQKIALGHIFKTDVIKLHIFENYSREQLITTTFAILEGMSQVLQIERMDISGLVAYGDCSNYDIILFDNVPGGAGHVKRLADETILDRVLKAAYDTVNRDCCDEETTCYNCLRTYYNQGYHKIMKRKYAKEVLRDLIKGEEQE